MEQKLDTIIMLPRLIILLPLFFIIFTVVWVSVKKWSLFSEPVGFLVAVCVSVLCIMGLFNIGKTDSHTPVNIAAASLNDAASTQPDEQKINFILLPYAALAVSILLVFLFAMLLRAWSAMKKMFGPLSHRTDRAAMTNQPLMKSRHLWYPGEKIRTPKE